jgi:hypothetical protein
MQDMRLTDKGGNMKRKLLVAAVLALAVIISQCAKETDEDAILDLIAADTIYFNTDTEGDSAAQEYSLSRDTTILWWRGPQTHSQPIIEINIAEDSAWVSWSRANYGDLRIIRIDTLDDWTKPLSETAELRATFLRTGTEDDEYRGWELHTISLAYGESTPSSTVRIDSVRINSDSYPDTLILDPLNTFFDVENLITFQPLESCTVTLYTDTPEGHAFLHTYILTWPYFVRDEFTHIADGVYQGVWTAQVVAVPRFAIFDLMPHSTLYTPDQPYDFNGWLLPYTISQ